MGTGTGTGAGVEAGSALGKADKGPRDEDKAQGADGDGNGDGEAVVAQPDGSVAGSSGKADEVSLGIGKGIDRLVQSLDLGKDVKSPPAPAKS